MLLFVNKHYVVRKMINFFIEIKKYLNLKDF